VKDVSSFSVSLLAGHYQFDQESTKKKKALSKSFVDLIIINTWFNSIMHMLAEELDITGLIQLLNEVLSEKNAIWISPWRTSVRVLLKHKRCCSLRMSTVLKQMFRM
jgi:hypothetical protein